MTNTMPRIRTIREASLETGVSSFCIRRLCLEDKIVYFKAGNRFMVNLDKLIEFFNGENDDWDK